VSKGKPHCGSSHVGTCSVRVW